VRDADVGQALHEFPDLGLRFEEFLDPLAQCGLSGTRLVKVGGPFGGRTVQRGRKDGFFGSRIVFAHRNTFRCLLLYMRKSAATTIIGIDPFKHSNCLPVQVKFFNVETDFHFNLPIQRIVS